jgi:hypothetical protein
VTGGAADAVVAQGKRAASKARMIHFFMVDIPSLDRKLLWGDFVSKTPV